MSHAVCFFGGMWTIFTIGFTVLFIRGTPDDFFKGRENFCGIASFALAAIISAAICAIMYGMG